jgi:hypothetical protein
MSRPASLSDFAGQWQFERVIEDAHAGQTATASGQAVWTEDGIDQLRYDETGVLLLPDAAPMQMQRSYIWQADETGIDICFDTGLPFHRISFFQATQSDVHLCAMDIYKVRYFFTHWPEWSSIWAVSGPKKNYVMRTLYSVAS